jgi:hypothetical protein
MPRKWLENLIGGLSLSDLIGANLVITTSKRSSCILPRRKTTLPGILAAAPAFLVMVNVSSSSERRVLQPPISRVFLIRNERMAGLRNDIGEVECQSNIDVKSD